mgnify:CR=1 FL=1
MTANRSRLPGVPYCVFARALATLPTGFSWLLQMPSREERVVDARICGEWVRRLSPENSARGRKGR